MATRRPWRYDWTPSRWLREIRARIRQDWDQVIVITGEERTGKSTIAFRLAHALDLHGFDLSRTIFRGTDLMDVAEQARAGNVIWVDEFVEGGDARETMSSANRKLVNYFRVAGERNLIYLILFPQLQNLDKKIREQRAHWHVHVPRRGVAEVEAADREGRHRKGTYWRALNFGDDGDFTFPKVEGPAWRAYEERKRRFVDEYGRNLSASDRTKTDPASEPKEGLEEIRAIHRLRVPWLEGRVRDRLEADLTSDQREIAEEKGLIG